MKIFKLITLLAFLGCKDVSKKEVHSEPNNTNKVILITLDGLRWQELFSGADAELITNKTYVKDTTALKKTFWKATPQERRNTLFPFIWKTVSKIGQIHGNRTLHSNMNLTNQMHFSYPGYNEILTGKADDVHITSNDKIPNPNVTILEATQNDARYKNKVAAFGSWDVFPSIINETRSGIYVNAGFKEAKGNKLTEKEIFLNTLQKQIPSPWGSVRLDAFTHHYALETIKKDHPSFVYISYGETDDFAHDGHYDAYLKSAKTTDGFIKELWSFTQSDPFYKGQTTFIITTDHGRGTVPLDTWRSHGKSIKGADEVWLITFGNHITAKGEIIDKEQLYTNQVAATVANLLDLKFESAKGLALKF